MIAQICQSLQSTDMHQTLKLHIIIGCARDFLLHNLEIYRVGICTCEVPKLDLAFNDQNLLLKLLRILKQWSHTFKIY